MNKNQYDVFISHASADKISYVDKLASAIKDVGLSVFYDQESIEWGDSIKECINNGLSSCSRAVVVISENYFGREWTEYEIETLLWRQDLEGKKLIMPILHGVSKRQLVAHYPELSDIKFKYSKNNSCEKLASILYRDIVSNGG